MATLIVTTSSQFAARAAQEIAARIDGAVGAHGACALAVSGGRTPIPVFHRLAAEAIPCRQVALYFADERAVPPDHEDSNYGMVRRELLDRLPVAPRVFRMEGERTDTDAAARTYENLLPPALDVLVLGIGPDGHTASLFPGLAAVSESRRRVVAVPPAPVAPHVPRITITPPVIAAAREVVMLVSQGERADVVARALAGSGDPRDCPARLARDGTWILTEDAASQLQRGGD
ncbi:MAG: 6-phosphogluconolactonase [Gemmatimonadales bacterium]